MILNECIVMRKCFPVEFLLFAWQEIKANQVFFLDKYSTLLHSKWLNSIILLNCLSKKSVSFSLNIFQSKCAKAHFAHFIDLDTDLEFDFDEKTSPI